MHLRRSALLYWCGFAETKALGIFPHKGSKAVHVLRPQVHQRARAGWWRRARWMVLDLVSVGMVMVMASHRLLRAPLPDAHDLFAGSLQCEIDCS
jgi:hypothetical protein